MNIKAAAVIAHRAARLNAQGRDFEWNWLCRQLDIASSQWRSALMRNPALKEQAIAALRLGCRDAVKDRLLALYVRERIGLVADAVGERITNETIERLLAPHDP